MDQVIQKTWEKLQANKYEGQQAHNFVLPLLKKPNPTKHEESILSLPVSIKTRRKTVEVRVKIRSDGKSANNLKKEDLNFFRCCHLPFKKLNFSKDEIARKQYRSVGEINLSPKKIHLQSLEPEPNHISLKNNCTRIYPRMKTRRPNLIFDQGHRRKSLKMLKNQIHSNSFPGSENDDRIPGIQGFNSILFQMKNKLESKKIIQKSEKSEEYNQKRIRRQLVLDLMNYDCTPWKTLPDEDEYRAENFYTSP